MIYHAFANGFLEGTERRNQGSCEQEEDDSYSGQVAAQARCPSVSTGIGLGHQGRYEGFFFFPFSFFRVTCVYIRATSSLMGRIHAQRVIQAGAR